MKNTKKKNQSKRPSLTFLVQQELNKKVRRGQSKHADKLDPKINTKDYIYSNKTYINYRIWCIDFTNFCKLQTPKPRTLEDCEQFIPNYIEYMVEYKKYSAYTINSKLSALTKLYSGSSITDFKRTTDVVVPNRLRANIKNNRGSRPDSNHFAEKNHEELINFARATGLRKAGLNRVKIADIDFKNETVTIREKGGKIRTSVVLDMAAVEVVVARARAVGQDHLFGGRSFKNPKEFTPHRCRAEYATELYSRIARPLETLTKKQKYHCKGDKLGFVYDRQAMIVVSKNLGHNRIDVIAGHYLNK